jgi:N-succinyldiaminopimelate aminotransferase
MHPIARRVSGFGTTIFSEINALANDHQAVNLGQGKPDFDGPLPIRQAAAGAILEGQHNQYPPGTGILALREAIAAHEERFYNYAPNPDNEVVVTVGATEAMFAAIMGLTDPGDEVIVFEPFYDSYVPAIQMAGAVPRYIPLHPPEWHFDRDELAKLFSDKTRAIIINTPHNPTGKMFSPNELYFIAELCQKYQVIAITDEVYEHITYDDTTHHTMISIPEMRQQTVKISSLGKTFSVTGWKIGWAIGNSEMLAGVQRARQYMTFTPAHPLQHGAVKALQCDLDYYAELQTMYQRKRDLLVTMLADAGLEPSTPQGSYFVMADFSAIFDGDDVAFARWLIEAGGVACIPPTFFYTPAHRDVVAKQARFAFCKQDSVLAAAAEKMQQLARANKA